METISNIEECDDYRVLSKQVHPNKDNPEILHSLLMRIFKIAQNINQFCCVYANAHPDSELKKQAREKLLSTSTTLYDFCRICCMTKGQNDLLDFAYQNIMRLTQDFKSASFVYLEVYKDTPPYVHATEKMIEYCLDGEEFYEIVRQNKTEDELLLKKINNKLMQLGSKQLSFPGVQIETSPKSKTKITKTKPLAIIKTKPVKTIHPDTGLLSEKNIAKIVKIIANSPIMPDLHAELIQKIKFNRKNIDLLFEHIAKNLPVSNHHCKNISMNVAVLADFKLESLFRICELLPHRTDFVQPVTELFTNNNSDFELIYQTIFVKTPKQVQHRLVSMMLRLAQRPDQVLLVYSRINTLNDKRNECVARLYEIAESFDDWDQIYRYESDTDKLQYIFKKMLLVSTKINELCFIHNTTKHYPELYEQATHKIIALVTGISSMCYVYNHIQVSSRLYHVIEEMIIMQAKTPRITGKILRKVPTASSLHKRVQELHGKLQLSYIEKRNAVSPEDEEDEHLFQILLRYEPVNY